MATHAFYSGGTPSGETSATHDVNSASTFSVDFDNAPGETVPPVTLLYKMPSSGRTVQIIRFTGGGTVALDRAPRTLAVQVGDNPDNVPVYAELQSG